MPTYEFFHSTEDCKHEWEEVRSIVAPDPTTCPKCGKEGDIIHLVSGGSGKGVVLLEGQDLKDKVKEDTKKLVADSRKSENTYANLLGEDRYQASRQKTDKWRRR